MSDNTPLTIENFDSEKLRAKAFESKKSGEFTLLFLSNMMKGIQLLRLRETLDCLNT